MDTGHGGVLKVAGMLTRSGTPQSTRTRTHTHRGSHTYQKNKILSGISLTALVDQGEAVEGSHDFALAGVDNALRGNMVSARNFRPDNILKH